MTEPPSRPLPSRVRLILGVLVVVGAAVIGAAWKVADGPFLDDLLLTIGGGILLFAALFWLEEGLRRQITAVRQDAQAVREGVVKIGEEALAIVKRVEEVEETAAETKARLDDLADISKEVMERRAAEWQQAFETAREDLSPQALHNLLQKAIEVRAIATDGFRIRVGTTPVWLRFTPDTRDTTVTVRAERGNGEPIAVSEWQPDSNVRQLVGELATLLEAAGAGTAAFDATPILRDLVDQVETLVLVRPGLKQGTRDLDPAVELPAPQWAITMFGLEATDNSYQIEWERIDQPDWVKHVSEKNWVDPEQFQYALGIARVYWARYQHQSEYKYGPDGAPF